MARPITPLPWTSGAPLPTRREALRKHLMARYGTLGADVAAYVDAALSEQPPAPVVEPAPAPTYVPVRVAAQQLGCDPKTVRRWAHAGKLPSLQVVAGGPIRVAAEALAALGTARNGRD
jgi:excisionase family DNA binding protein